MRGGSCWFDCAPHTVLLLCGDPPEGTKLMLKVKSFLQSAGYCGPACLKMVLEFYGVKKTEIELAKLSGATHKDGVAPAGLLKAANKLGLKGFTKDNATFKDIEKHLKRNIPVIVGWFSQTDGHYSVVVDIDKKFIYLRDPEWSKIHKIDLRTFYRVWFDFMGDFLESSKDVMIRPIIVIYPRSK